MSPIIQLFVLLLVILMSGPASGTTTPTMTRAQYLQYFNRVDAASRIFNGKLSDKDNSTGKFAWLESYLLQAYMQLYRATGDRDYLRRLTHRFDAILAVRDD